MLFIIVVYYYYCVDLVVVSMHYGLAYICVITTHMTITKANIEQTIPRKRKGVTSQHDKAIERFFEAILQGILRSIDFSVVKCIVLASPGYVKDDFFTYMMENAVRRDMKAIVENKEKFIKTHSTSGHKHAIKEILSDSGVAGRLSDTKAAGEIIALERFFKMLNDDPERAYYGFKHVNAACQSLAIDTVHIYNSIIE